MKPAYGTDLHEDWAAGEPLAKDSSPPDNLILKTALVYIFLLVALLATALPAGTRTELSLKKGSPGCTPYLQEVLFSCRSDKALTPMSTLDDVIAVYQLNDHASTAKAAKTGYKAVAAYWPPGIIILEGLLYAISPAFPIGLALVPIVCALWAGAMTAVWRVGYMKSGSVMLSMLPVALLTALIDVKTYIGFGVFLSEAYAIPSFLLGVGVLVNILNRPHPRLAAAAVAGLFFAIAAYFRAQFDQIMVLSTAALMLGAVLLLVLRRFVTIPQGASAAFKAIIISVCAYHALTLPYRLTHYLSWVDTSNAVVWRLTWEDPAWFTGEYSFFTVGGGAAGCVVDPVRCQHIRDQLPSKEPGALVKAGSNPGQFLTNPILQKHTFKSFISHPFKWISFKLPYILNGIADTGKAIFIYSSILILLWLAATIQTPSLIAASLALTATTGAIIVPLFLIHLEPRYLDPLTTLAPFAAMLALAECLRPVGRKPLTRSVNA